MIAKTATVPLLDEPYQLTEEQKVSFRNNGHILLPGVLKREEVETYRPLILQAAEKMNTEKRKLEERDTYGKAFLQIMNLWIQDQQVRNFTLAKRFGRIAADLMGVSNVRIYHDQALFKEPGGGPTPWHQDQFYWPIDTHNTITMWMPLVDIDIAMGMLTFASGSHSKGYVFDFEISDESDQAYEDYVRSNGFPVTRAEKMQAGDATFHYGFTMHNAPGNLSALMREVMTIIYVADGATITAPKHKWQENDHKTWLRGLPVGSQVNSDLNPLVL
jgi:ectoine hydroxylase-related dioxygenase (phytanoyl-CoA dioxygenase family)